MWVQVFISLSVSPYQQLDTWKNSSGCALFFTALSVPGFAQALPSVSIWYALCLENHAVLLEGVTSLAALGTWSSWSHLSPCNEWAPHSIDGHSRRDTNESLGTNYHLTSYYGMEMGRTLSGSDLWGWLKEREGTHRWPKRNPSRWRWCMSSICLIYLVSATCMWWRALDYVSGKSERGLAVGEMSLSVFQPSHHVP